MFVDINKILSESYADLNNYEKAHRYHQIFSRTGDSLLEETEKQSLANAEAEFQNKNKQKEIKTLSARKIVFIFLSKILKICKYSQTKNICKRNEKFDQQ